MPVVLRCWNERLAWSPYLPASQVVVFGLLRYFMGRAFRDIVLQETSKLNFTKYQLDLLPMLQGLLVHLIAFLLLLQISSL
jgi:hypothetical protein